jgi:hypothetical protein
MAIRSLLGGIAASAALACSLCCAAQDKGSWHAFDSAAKAITGDIEISDANLIINNITFSITLVRPLDPSEADMVFAPSKSSGAGYLYRLKVPTGTQFLHRNGLCVGEDTKWMATYVTAGELQVAFFGKDDPPTITKDALESGPTELCVTLAYSR